MVESDDIWVRVTWPSVSQVSSTESDWLRRERSQEIKASFRFSWMVTISGTRAGMTRRLSGYLPSMVLAMRVSGQERNRTRGSVGSVGSVGSG